MRLKYLKANRRHKGLSIIEVAMASVLLIVAMVPILRSLSNANRMSSEVERKTQDLVLAQGKLDSIRASSVHSFGSTGSFTTTNSVVLSGSYLCNVTDTATADPNLRQITVYVGYDDKGDGTLSSSEVDVTLTTYIANRS
ncbi:MAG: hypothetical protein ABSG97_09615 [Sedimentisphaerales bacterium]|jgi:Tfp pilus assembly protein PilV